VDDNISSTIHKALKAQKTVVRTKKIPHPRARVDALVDEKTNTRIQHRRLEKMKSRVGGAVSSGDEQVLERLLDSKNREFCHLFVI
jgi:hypothetical protein